MYGKSREGIQILGPMLTWASLVNLRIKYNSSDTEVMVTQGLETWHTPV